MPGIFGLIAKKATPQKDLKHYLQLMSNRLKHQEWYFCQDHMDDRSLLGNITIRKRFEIYSINRDHHDYVVLIDGYIYKIGSQRTDTFGNAFFDIASRVVDVIRAKNLNKLLLIEGNYVVAVYDKTEQRFYLFNDIIGPRRIYYADFSDYFVFSQEVKAISCLPFYKKEMDIKGVSNFLNYGYVLGENTFFNSIHSLPSGTLIRFNLKEGKFEKEKYWSPLYPESSMNMEEASEEVYRLLGDSLAEKLHPGDTIISPISGGLDSRIILGRLTTIEKEFIIKPFTYGQDFSYEYKYAKKVCGKLGLTNHFLVNILPEFLLDKYEQAAWFTDGMSSINNSHLLIFPRELGVNFDYLFNGIYGGPTNYDALYYRPEHLEGKYTHEEKTEDIRKVISLSLDRYEKILAPSLFGHVSLTQSSSIAEELSRHLAASERFCNQRDAFFIENRMRRGICQAALYRFFWEEQLPLSHYPFYHFYLKTPPQLKLHRSLLKATLIRKFPALAKIADANTGLNLFKQPSLWHRQKVKLSSDLRYYLNRLSSGRIIFYDRSTYAHNSSWFQQHEPTYQFFRRWILSEIALESGFLQNKNIESFINAVRKTSLGFDQLVRIVTLLIWYKLFYLEESNDTQQQIKIFYK